MHCVGVVSPGNFLSAEGFGSDSAPSETSWVSVSNFASGVVYAHEIFFMVIKGINEILDELVHN